MIVSPLLISSAQRASRKFKHVHAEREVGPKDFMYGPYKYLQSPTHMGIFMLSVGFSIVMNSVILIVATFIAYLITHLVFLPAEQKVLKRKYGATYEAYLKKVKLSI
jgi:protein-S-isoprenylcysteine O-methyltransferase Ste14